MTRPAVNVSILHPDVPVLRRAERARRDGWTAIESWWPFPTAGPSAAEVDAFVASVADAGVELIAMNLFGGDLAAGERGPGFRFVAEAGVRRWPRPGAWRG